MDLEAFVQYFLIFAIIFDGAIAWFVLLKNPRRAINQAYFFMIFWVTMWQLSNYAASYFGFYSETAFLFVGRSAFSAASILILAVIYFVHIFPNRKHDLKVALLLLPAALFSIIPSFNGWLVDYVFYAGASPRDYLFGRLYPYFIAYFLLGLLAVALIGFYKFFKSDREAEKRQVQYLLIGLMVPIVLSVVTHLLVPFFNFFLPGVAFFVSPVSDNLSPASTLFFSALTAYAILRHRLLDIRILLRRKAVMILGAGISVALIFVVLWQVVPLVFHLLTARSFFSDFRVSGLVYLIAVISTLSSMVIATYLFFHKPHNRLKVSFAFIALQVGLWGAAHLFGTVQTDPRMFVYFARSSLIAGLFLPATLVYFVSVLGARVYTKGRILLFFVLPLLMFPFALTDLNANGFHDGNLSYASVQIGPLYYFFIPYFIVFICGAVYKLRSIGRSSKSGITRQRTRYVSLGILVSSLIVIVTTAILPIGFEIVFDPNLGVISALFFTVMAAHSIVRHRLLDVRVLLQRSLVAGFFYLFSTAVFGLVAWMLLSAGIPVSGGADLWLLIFVFAMSLLVHIILWRPLRRLLYHFFPRAVVDLHKLTDDEEGILEKATSVEEFVRRFVSDLLQRVPVQLIVFYVYAHFSSSFRIVYPEQDAHHVDSGSEWLVEMMKSEKMDILRVSEISHRQLLAKARSHASEFILPLKFGERFVGVIFIGSRVDGASFSASDMDFFTEMRDCGSRTLWDVLQLEYATKNYISGNTKYY